MQDDCAVGSHDASHLTGTASTRPGRSSTPRQLSYAATSCVSLCMHRADPYRTRRETSLRSTASARCPASSSCARSSLWSGSIAQLKEGRQVEMVRGANPAGCAPPSSQLELTAEHRSRDQEAPRSGRLHSWPQLGPRSTSRRRRCQPAHAASSAAHRRHHQSRSADQGASRAHSICLTPKVILGLVLAYLVLSYLFA